MKTYILLIVALLSACAAQVPTEKHIDPLDQQYIEMYEPTTVVLNLEAESLGSGVIVKALKDNYYLILTNYHVIDGSKGKVVVLFGKNKARYDGIVIKHDEYADLALVLVKIPYTEKTPVTICDESARLFETVWAIGAGLGLPIHPTKGIVGNPSFKFPDETTQFIHHSAPIAPGNSGGPLFKLENGHYCVTGINSRGMMGIDAYGRPIPIAQFAFAIALNELKNFLKD